MNDKFEIGKAYRYIRNKHQINNNNWEWDIIWDISETGGQELLYNDIIVILEKLEANKLNELLKDMYKVLFNDKICRINLSIKRNFEEIIC